MGLRFKIKYYLGIAALQADWNVIPVEISKSSIMPTAGMRREILALTESFFQLMSLKQGKVCPLLSLPWLEFFLIMWIA